MTNKIKVLVLMGGRSPEHEISLVSGREVVASLNPNKYQVTPLIVSRDGKLWKLTTKEQLLQSGNPIDLRGTEQELAISKYQQISGPSDIAKDVDVVFIAMHGPFGEDGTVQGMLELANLKYTGPGVLPSALGMNKLLFRKVLSSEGLPQPEYLVYHRGGNLSSMKQTLGRAPYIVKPHNLGSSVGVSLVKRISNLPKAVEYAQKYSDITLIDHYIKGREVTCGILGNAQPFALPLVEIVPKNDFFDYESKYLSDQTQEIVPARINRKGTQKIQELALKVYQLLGCQGFARVDFIWSRNNQPYILEINTIPGLTPMSLLPKAARASGISYQKLIEQIIDYALENKS